MRARGNVVFWSRHPCSACLESIRIVYSEMFTDDGALADATFSKCHCPNGHFLSHTVRDMVDHDSVEDLIAAIEGNRFLRLPSVKDWSPREV